MANVFSRDIKLETSPSGVRRDSGPRRIEVLLAKAVAAEYLAVATTCLLTSIVYFKLAKMEWPPGFEYIAAIFLIPSLVVFSVIGFRQYSAIQAHSRDRFMLSGIGAVALAFALFLSFLFVVKIADWYSRGTFLFQVIGVSVVILIMRRSTYAYIRRSIYAGVVEARKAVLVGDVNLNAEIVKDLHQFGIRCAGVIELPCTHTNSLSGKAEFARDAKEFVERCRDLDPDDVIFLAAATDFSLVSMLVDFLSELPVSVHVVPVGVRGLWGAAKISNFGRTVAIQVLNPPLSRF